MLTADRARWSADIRAGRSPHRHQPFARSPHQDLGRAARREVCVEQLGARVSIAFLTRDAWARAIRNRAPPAEVAGARRTAYLRQRQKAEGRRQKAEGRRQKAEGSRHAGTFVHSSPGFSTQAGVFWRPASQGTPALTDFIDGREGMSGPTSYPEHETGERHWRLKSALLESPIASSASLEVLVARLYRRDPDSLAHLHRVSAGARRIGGEMGLVGHELDDVEHAALIHDLGRIILPDWSESCADNREKSVMRRRCASGSDLLRADQGHSVLVAGLGDCRRIARILRRHRSAGRTARPRDSGRRSRAGRGRRARRADLGVSGAVVFARLGHRRARQASGFPLRSGSGRGVPPLFR